MLSLMGFYSPMLCEHLYKVFSEKEEDYISRIILSSDLKCIKDLKDLKDLKIMKDLIKPNEINSQRHKYDNSFNDPIYDPTIDLNYESKYEYKNSSNSETNSNSNCKSNTSNYLSNSNSKPNLIVNKRDHIFWEKSSIFNKTSERRKKFEDKHYITTSEDSYSVFEVEPDYSDNDSPISPTLESGFNEFNTLNSYNFSKNENYFNLGYSNQYNKEESNETSLFPTKSLSSSLSSNSFNELNEYNEFQLTNTNYTHNKKSNTNTKSKENANSSKNKRNSTNTNLSSSVQSKSSEFSDIDISILTESELIHKIDILKTGTITRKLQLIFNIFDIEREGIIRKENVMKILKELYVMLGDAIQMGSQGSGDGDEMPSDLDSIVQSKFDSMDENNRGYLLYEEYEKAVFETPEIQMALGLKVE